MLVALPFLQSSFSISVLAAIFAILAIGFFAGVLSPAHRMFMLLDTLIAAFAFIVFEYYAVIAYNEPDSLFFAVNQVLALNFFTAFYYSTKTLRGSMVSHHGDEIDHSIIGNFRYKHPYIASEDKDAVEGGISR